MLGTERKPKMKVYLWYKSLKSDYSLLNNDKGWSFDNQGREGGIAHNNLVIRTLHDLLTFKFSFNFVLMFILMLIFYSFKIFKNAWYLSIWMNHYSAGKVMMSQLTCFCFCYLFSSFFIHCLDQARH